MFWYAQQCRHSPLKTIQIGQPSYLNNHSQQSQKDDTAHSRQFIKPTTVKDNVSNNNLSQLVSFNKEKVAVEKTHMSFK